MQYVLRITEISAGNRQTLTFLQGDPINMDHSNSLQRVVRVDSRGAFMRISVSLFLVLLAASLSVAAETGTTNIKVDQVGYLPNAPKIALIDSTSTDPRRRRILRSSVQAITRLF